jgi:hypothetical protein
LRSARRLAFALALSLPSGCGADASAPREPDLGALELTTSPDAASVFLDGRYVGETGPEGPLRLVHSAGSYQLRVSARGCSDLATSLELRAGRAVAARASLAAAGAGATDLPDDVRIDVGQVARAELGLAPGARPGDKPRRFHVYSFDARRGQQRSLVLHSATGPVELGIVGPDDEITSVVREGAFHGNPPEVSRWRLVADRDGRYRLVVRAPAGPVRYVIGLEKAAPDPYSGATPSPEGRRLPGRPESD